MSTFDQQPGGVLQLLFSADNPRCCRRRTRIKRSASGGLESPFCSATPRLIGHSLEVWRLALMPDGKTLISGGKDGAVRLWDLTRLPQARGPPVGLPAGPFVAWSFAGREPDVITSDRKGQITRWSGSGWQTSTRLLNTERAMSAACFLPELQQRVAPGHDGALHVFGGSGSSTPRALPVFPAANWICACGATGIGWRWGGWTSESFTTSMGTRGKESVPGPLPSRSGDGFQSLVVETNQPGA